MKIELLRALLRVFWLLPINNKKVVITSYNGRKFSCNPKYLALALLRTDAKVYFAQRKNYNPELPADIKPIRYRSVSHFIHLMTAKYIVVNSTGITELVPFRSNQVLINTWHGGGYFKAIGNDHFVSTEQKRKRKIAGKNTTFFFASCEKFAEQLPRSMCVKSQNVYRIGLPRNDLFFTEQTAIRDKVYEYFKIEKNIGIVLYAPTYRDGAVKDINESGFLPIDVDGVLSALKKRFQKEYVFMFKAHHNMVPENLSAKCINASFYEDIQELLSAAEVLITDYSSCMWDYCLSRKAGLLYTPDIDNYSKVHSFGTPPSVWPFSICKSNEEIVERILAFDMTENARKIDDYLSYMGSFEDGKSIERIEKEIFTELVQIGEVKNG